MTLSLATLGMAALGTGEPAESWQYLEESLSAYQGIVTTDWESWVLAFPGYAAHKLGRLAQARQCFCRAIQVASERNLYGDICHLHS